DASGVDVLGEADHRRGKCRFKARKAFRIRPGDGEVDFLCEIVGWPQSFEPGALEKPNHLLRRPREPRLPARSLGEPDRLEMAAAVEIVELLGFGVAGGVFGSA